MENLQQVLDLEKKLHRDMIVTFRLTRLVTLWRGDLERAYKVFEMSLALVRPLVYLILMPEGLSQHELAEALQCDDSSLVRIIDTLERKKIVKRKPDLNDRRLKRIYVTQSGKKLFEFICNTTIDVENNILKSINDEQEEELIQTIDKIILNFNDEKWRDRRTLD